VSPTNSTTVREEIDDDTLVGSASLFSEDSTILESESAGEGLFGVNADEVDAKSDRLHTYDERDLEGRRIIFYRHADGSVRCRLCC
jgi:hypothetical protein